MHVGLLLHFDLPHLASLLNLFHLVFTNLQHKAVLTCALISCISIFQPKYFHHLAMLFTHQWSTWSYSLDTDEVEQTRARLSGRTRPDIRLSMLMIVLVAAVVCSLLLRSGNVESNPGPGRYAGTV